MKLLKAFAAGVAGSVGMSVYMRLQSLWTHKELKIIKVLGSILTNRVPENGKVSSSTKSQVTGALTHLTIGTIFTFCYYYLWKKGIAKPDLKGGAVLGFMNGIIGLIGWRLLFLLPTNNPKIDLKSYLLNLMIAHEVFGIIVNEVYKE